MSDNSQKTPFARSLQRFTGNVARAATNLLAKCAPASVLEMSGPHAVVNFETTANLPGQVTMPILGSRSFRTDHTGEQGYTPSGDYYMGGVSGLGGGVADLTQHGNLSTGAWAPVSNTNWPSIPGATTVVTGKASGLILRDSEGNETVINLTTSGIVITTTQVTFNVPTVTINGNLIVTGSISG